MAKGENRRKMRRGGGKSGYKHAHSSHMGKGSVLKKSHWMDALYYQTKRLEKKLVKP